MLKMLINLMYLFLPYGVGEYFRTNTMLMTICLFVLLACYIAALAERLTKPEIIELVDGKPESMGYDNTYEIEYLNTRDYYLAADHGFGHESIWDF